jgi:hypothetical protein
MSISLAASSRADFMQSSQGQVLVSNFVASQAGQISGVIPLPLKPHLLQVNSSWILLQEVGM